MASGTFRHPWVLCVLSAGSVFAVAASAAAPPDQTPAAAAPQSAAAQPAPAESTTAAAEDSATTTKPADGGVRKIVLIDNGINDEQLKQILAKGYRPESHQGITVYCHKEAPVGTRFATKICRTSANILETEQKGKDVTSNVQRTTGNATGK